MLPVGRRPEATIAIPTLPWTLSTSASPSGLLPPPGGLRLIWATTWAPVGPVAPVAPVAPVVPVVRSCPRDGRGGGTPVRLARAPTREHHDQDHRHHDDRTAAQQDRTADSRACALGALAPLPLGRDLRRVRLRGLSGLPGHRGSGGRGRRRARRGTPLGGDLRERLLRNLLKLGGYDPGPRALARGLREVVTYLVGDRSGKRAQQVVGDQPTTLGRAPWSRGRGRRARPAPARARRHDRSTAAERSRRSCAPARARARGPRAGRAAGCRLRPSRALA